MDITVTVGPASCSKEALERIIDAGARGFRFPLSKEDPETHVERANLVRSVAAAKEVEIDLIADTPGLKPRLLAREPTEVFVEKLYSVDVSGSSASKEADFVLFPAVNSRFLADGSSAVIGDGENSFVITGHRDAVILGRFGRSGVVERNRAFIPIHDGFRIESFGQSDRSLLKRAREGNFDYVALSFVANARTLLEARNFLDKELGWEPRLIAKIETRAGVEAVRSIARGADGVLIGRGDLAIACGFEVLGGLQREIAEVCVEEGTFCIAGTGFLDTFAQTGSPTRSECADIWAALDSGIDGIMLSAETTIGKFPVEAVAFLKSIMDVRREKALQNMGSKSRHAG